MKKSEMYFEAQKAVLRTTQIGESDKLQILRELQEREGMARCLEKEGDEE